MPQGAAFGRLLALRSLAGMPSPSVPRLEPLEAGGYERFWSLFQESMSAGVDEFVAGLGISREEYERLPQEIGELRQIESDGETAGYLWLEVRGRELHVHALLLEPEHRGRGLGGRALESLVDTYTDEVDVVELGVEPDNAAARTVDERAGFEYVGERLGFLIMRRDVRLDKSRGSLVR